MKKTIIKQCIICKTEFETDTSHPNAKYCSESCRQKARYRKNNPKKTIEDLKRTCQHCGKGFVTDICHPNAKFCSKDCGRHNPNPNKREKYKFSKIYKTCERCGKGFEGYLWQKFCCRSCTVKTCHERDYVVRTHKKQIKDVKKKCVICSNEFYVDRSHANAKYCSIKCKNKKKYINNKDYYKGKANKWYHENTEQARVNVQKYKEENMDKIRFWKAVHCKKRNTVIKAQKAAGVKLITYSDIKDIKNRDDGLCVYCGTDKNVCKYGDHIIPLIPREGFAGGFHVKENYVTCCQGCNMSKSNQDVLTWCSAVKIPVPEIVQVQLDIMFKKYRT